MPNEFFTASKQKKNALGKKKNEPMKDKTS